MEKVKNQNLGNKKVVAEWARITLKELKEKIKRLKIKSSGDLYNTITYHLVSASGGDITKIEFLHNNYGKYVDMGVGNGMPIGGRRERGDESYLKRRNEKGQVLNHGRKAKKWYNKTMTHEVFRLSEILSDMYGTLLISSINENLPNEINIKL